MTAGGHGTSKRAGVVGSVAVALGIGAAIAGGIGSAHADGPTGGATSAESSASPSAVKPTTAELSTRKPATPKTAVRRSMTAAAPSRAAADVFTAAREEAAIAGIAEPSTPTPADAISTAYGDIGKWMLKANGQIADWGGKRLGGKKLLETVNVIIVDPHSTTGAQANRGLNNAMLRSRFPAQPLHNVGFRGAIDGVTYGQKPKGPLLAYSNNFFLFRNDHGRFFGPDPIQTDAGFVWSGAFSTERVGFSGLLPGHVYVSSNEARDALATALISGGQATYGGLVPLENAYNTPTTTTGDHDGFAVVLVLTGSAPLQRREVAMGSPARFVSAGDRRELGCAAPHGARSTANDRNAPLPYCAAVRRPNLDI
ncbi:hypothetical protein H7J08_28830 [Mycobacterium frederiksbergense]|uniref:Uncharacterized protein n=1 Tax=Mycolicibacterium frederiksbergense TaxID=117567 RepID=A0A6H0S7J6_9MYCO|nr:hypothetical protein [Mycolicibacterium frederiksbergense]MCV7048636.1 hypothetical protein [Mycolicibacterium frederiksbergense]QIV83483.1 hypothetical protein EXE63_23280 [Mycolicibacterium frederiksbergense]